MICRCILPEWSAQKHPNQPKVIEGDFDFNQIMEHNENDYNIYTFPNYPNNYISGVTVDGPQIDVFKYVFVDMDLKEGKYSSKEQFIDKLHAFSLLPTSIVDSGNGVHAYWSVSDLNAMDYLKFQRRLIRHFNTDEAVSKICQLMRVPGTVNTKVEGDFKICQEIYRNDNVYTAEDLDRALPPITPADEAFCKQHYDRTYGTGEVKIEILDKMPLKFDKLLKDNQEARNIWKGGLDDRSGGDFRLGHIMYAAGFTQAEARTVLVNAAKALQRSPAHRLSYANGIIDKIWTFEEAPNKDFVPLSTSVRDILVKKDTDALRGVRFPCWDYFDNTVNGFRLGQVIGLIAGTGVGKTAVTLNMFMGFVEKNPDYDHLFVSLEQPAAEIALRWKTICGEKEHLHEKVQVLSNYEDSGQFRQLSFDQIRDYILQYNQATGRKIGCVVIDHIGILTQGSKLGENQAIMDICKKMKAFAQATNTMLVMQSQAPREKSGIGDLELNKDAAYGTGYFEHYCDYLVTLWQPLKRCYSDGAPTVTAFKFCKIRHKKQMEDVIKEDVCYKLLFDSRTEQLRELTQDEETNFKFYVNRATNKRKADNKTSVVEYKSVVWAKEKDNGEANNNQNPSGIRRPSQVH